MSAATETCPHCGWRRFTDGARIHVQSQDAQCEPYDVLDQIARIIQGMSTSLRAYPDVGRIAAAVDAAGGRAKPLPALADRKELVPE